MGVWYRRLALRISSKRMAVLVVSERRQSYDQPNGVDSPPHRDLLVGPGTAARSVVDTDNFLADVHWTYLATFFASLASIC
jgi:hypothetical protein